MFLSEAQLHRYTRQMILHEFGESGQLALLDSTVCIIGMGGLGTAAAIYLTAAGIGRLIINDYDRVSLSNLHRQILYNTAEVGQKKTQAAYERLQQINPDLAIHSISHKLSAAELEQQLQQTDLVLDCSDNFTTRQLINQVCAKTRTPLISGAAIRWQGQLCGFFLEQATPCYACLFPAATDQAERCSEVGVIGPVVGTIGNLQALEAIKHLTGIGSSMQGKLLRFDGQQQRWQIAVIQPDSSCSICNF